MSILNETAQQHFQQMNERSDLSYLNAKQQNTLLKLFSLSDFVAQSCLYQPALIPVLLENLILPIDTHTIEFELQRALSAVDNEPQLHVVLRQFRRKYMLLIACRELLGHSSIQESFTCLSFLADQVITQSLSWLYQRQCTELGTPINKQDEAQYMYVLAMGKLGGEELNFSSDIDLIFAYPERSKTQGGRRVIESPNFFTKLGQRLISALHQVTVDGFVFRVDMRLRPFGESGPLVSTFSSLEDYYQTHGREWERFAMVKARVIGEEGPRKQQLEHLLHPFVFKRYVDFSAIDALRKMKGMISAEVRRKQLQDNIKLGAGGIREVEFVAQAIQLIHGGRHPELQCKGLLQTLAVIAQLGLMEQAQIATLRDVYLFLRQVENTLQQIDDKQTQTLPDNERDQMRLISVLGHQTWSEFYQVLCQNMALVHTAFKHFIGEETKRDNPCDSIYSDIWLLQLTQEELNHSLVESQLIKVKEANQINDLSQSILSLKEEVKKRPIGPKGQETLDNLMPKLLMLSVVERQPLKVFQRIQQVILNIMRRTAYLQLLNENQGALKHLIRLCAASPRVATQLARYPILLDELLDPQQLYQPTELGQYTSALQQFMMRVPQEDMEQQMEALRQFKQMQFLHIATADIAQGIALPEVSDHLTRLSEVLLDYVVQLAWSQMLEKFGCPSNVEGTEGKGFCVIAYGKMGGFELGYGSDLDIVFLHQSHLSGNTLGERSIDNPRFYFRLAQRIIHLFSARTNSGVLYEIDMRLRPSGDSGPLVASVSGFKHYLKESAWTWELQALVRARVVFADLPMQDEFNHIRCTILSQSRDDEQLKLAVTDMRKKMRKHLNRANTAEFDLKQSLGGMVDIEFIAQYLVLAHATQFSQPLTKWSDNLRIFTACRQVGLLSELQAQHLSEAYCHIRDASHRLTLNQEPRIVEASCFEQERKVVMDIWAFLFREVNERG